MDEKELVDAYLRRCEEYCNKGGYYRLGSSFGNIRKEVLKKYGGNGAKNLVEICQKITEEHLEDLSSKNTRIFGWDFCEEGKLRDKINNAFRSA